MNLRSLHRRLSALLALTSLAAFVSGAGLDAPSVLPAAALLLLGLAWDVPERLRARAELLWRVLATLLALRAAYHALFVPEDVVLPMVDLLLLLVLAETFRSQDTTGEARLYALSFALLIAAAAYRPGFVFGIAYIAYIAILTVTLTVGQLARRARDRNVREPRLPRRFLWQSAAISMVVLFVSALVFLAFPRVSRGWATRGGPVIRNVMGFSDRVSLMDHGGRLYANPEVVLRVEFPGGERPASNRLYFRGRSYDRFDGWSWSRSPFLPSALVETARWPQGRVEQVIYQGALGDANVLFGLSPVLRVNARSRIAPFRENNGDYTYAGGDQPVYSAVSIAGQPPADSLRGASGAGSRVLGAYLRVPPLAPRITALADSLTRDQPTSYDKALAVGSWLQREFRYTVELPATAREATLDHFLFERRAGHCEYFSTAMAVLLRAAGVPARNVNGFMGGEWNEFGNYLTVTQNQAHSWVEVWFPGYGWVLFDPTPAASAELLAARQGWWSPLRFLFDGVEHRWGKWVLDFNLETQANLVRGAAEALDTSRGGSTSSRSLPWLQVAVASIALAFAAGLLRARRPPGDRRTARSASRPYLRLRRAYQRRGWSEPHVPPLQFAERLVRADAPGARDAAAAVRLYARVRFGAQELDEGERNELRRSTRAALRELRRAPRTRPSEGGAPTRRERSGATARGSAT